MGGFLRPEHTADLMAFGQNLAKTQVGTTTSHWDCGQRVTMPGNGGCLEGYLHVVSRRPLPRYSTGTRLRRTLAAARSLRL